MPYRKRKKTSHKLAAMRAARIRNIRQGPAPEYPPELPALRREIIIIDHDFGEVRHHIKLFKTKRIDCYRMEVDGETKIKKIGWSKTLEAIRKNFIRVGAWT